jgi:hypothetical protein
MFALLPPSPWQPALEVTFLVSLNLLAWVGFILFSKASTFRLILLLIVGSIGALLLAYLLNLPIAKIRGPHKEQSKVSSEENRDW